MGERRQSLKQHPWVEGHRICRTVKSSATLSAQTLHALVGGKKVVDETQVRVVNVECVKVFFNTSTDSMK